MTCALLSRFLLLVFVPASLFAQDSNSWQATQPFSSNYVSRVLGDRESLSGSSAAWLMDELSGSIVDAVGGITLVLNSGTSTYSVTGSPGYDPGITMNAVAGGYRKLGSESAVEFGTGNGNVLINMRVNGTLGAFSESFVTTIREAGTTGWSFRMITSTRQLEFSMIASDTTTVNGTWGNQTNDAIYNAFTDNLPHTYQFVVDRGGGTVEAFMDGVSFGTVSIASLAGKTIGSTGIGIACDYRVGVNRDVPLTVFFARVKKVSL